jgi:hypothetical protein
LIIYINIYLVFITCCIYKRVRREREGAREERGKRDSGGAGGGLWRDRTGERDAEGAWRG